MSGVEDTSRTSATDRGHVNFSICGFKRGISGAAHTGRHGEMTHGWQPPLRGQSPCTRASSSRGACQGQGRPGQDQAPFRQWGRTSWLLRGEGGRGGGEEQLRRIALEDRSARGVAGRGRRARQATKWAGEGEGEKGWEVRRGGFIGIRLAGGELSQPGSDHRIPGRPKRMPRPGDRSTPSVQAGTSDVNSHKEPGRIAFIRSHPSRLPRHHAQLIP